MTVSAASWSTASTRPSTTHVVGRLITAGVMLFAGLVMSTVALGVSLVYGLFDGGQVAGTSDGVALVRALNPVVPMIAVFGVAHLVAGVGAIVGGRTALQLGLGLAAVDVVAGILVMFASALSEKPALDGAGIGVVVLLLGTILFAAVRAATYDAAADPAVAA